LIETTTLLRGTQRMCEPDRFEQILGLSVTSRSEPGKQNRFGEDDIFDWRYKLPRRQAKLQKGAVVT
jgi:hypothetical protein